MLRANGPVLVPAQLPDSHPSKKAALEYIKAYEAANGAGSHSTFGAHTWDAGRLLQRAVPEALHRTFEAQLDLERVESVNELGFGVSNTGSFSVYSGTF